jgi:hypothetical protein
MQARFYIYAKDLLLPQIQLLTCTWHAYMSECKLHDAMMFPVQQFVCWYAGRESHHHSADSRCTCLHVLFYASCEQMKDAFSRLTRHFSHKDDSAAKDSKDSSSSGSSSSSSSSSSSTSSSSSSSTDTSAKP